MSVRGFVRNRRNNGFSTLIGPQELSLFTLSVVGAISAGVMTSALPPRAALLATFGLLGVLSILLLLIKGGTRPVASVALMVATGALAMNGLRINGSITIADVFLLGAGAILLPGLAIRAKQKLMAVQPLVTGTLLISFGGLIGSVVGPDPAASLNNVLLFTVAAVLMSVILASWEPTVTEIVRLSWLWVFSASISSLVALGETDEFRYGRADGLTNHQNHLALTCVLALGPLMALTLHARGIMRWIGIACGVALTGGLLVSGSRAGFLGLMVTLAAMAVLSRQKRVAAGVIGGAILGVVALSSPVVKLPKGNALARLLGSGEGGVQSGVVQSNEGRLERFREALNVAMENPLTGVGFEHAREAHNIYIQLWSSAGILGIIGLALVIRAVLSAPVSNFMHPKSSGDPTALILLLGFSASFIGYLAAGTFQNALWNRYIWLIPTLAVILAPHALRYRQVWDPGADRGTKLSHPKAGIAHSANSANHLQSDEVKRPR